MRKANDMLLLVSGRQMMLRKTNRVHECHRLKCSVEDNALEICWRSDPFADGDSPPGEEED